MNVGLPDLSKRSYLRKTVLSKKKKHKTKKNIRKVRETNIHSKNFLKFYSVHFGI